MEFLIHLAQFGISHMGINLVEAGKMLSLAPGEKFSFRGEVELESHGHGHFNPTKGQDQFRPAPRTIISEPDFYVVTSLEMPFPLFLVYIPPINRYETQFIILMLCPDRS